jgi:predicted short-subunit dehydrogenase-like oxidoreductase (DUF2520 family)
MRVVLIGRGRLATNLLPVLQQAGHEVSSINSRTLENLPEEADVFIIAVKDSALQEVISRATKGREQQLFVHTAGSMPMSLFEGYTNRFGVFYPMQTFSKERLVSFADIPVFIEGDNAVLRPLAESITHSVYELSSADRKYLHLSAVFACNFVNHCYALSAELLEKHGIPFSVMLPLIDETALKVHQLHPLEAQTGPAVRYDENVIRMQSSMLADSPLLQEIYNLLSVSIHRKSERND